MRKLSEKELEEEWISQEIAFCISVFALLLGVIIGFFGGKYL